jgi:hypothetical protein
MDMKVYLCLLEDINEPSYPSSVFNWMNRQFHTSHIFVSCTEYCGIFAQSMNCEARETAVASERL